MSSSSESDIPTASAPVHADRAHLVPTPVIEEPVLSHKAARKSKKRKLDQVVEGGDAGVEGKEKTVAQANAAAAQGKRTAYGVWIGNMAFKTDSFQLKNWLSGCGEIARCHMPAGTGGKEVKNKGLVPSLSVLRSATNICTRADSHMLISKRKRVSKRQ